MKGLPSVINRCENRHLCPVSGAVVVWKKQIKTVVLNCGYKPKGLGGYQAGEVGTVTKDRCGWQVGCLSELAQGHQS